MLGQYFGHAPGVTHWCSGADEYGCKIGWICTIEDGICEGAARCADCQGADMRKRDEDPDFYGFWNSD